MVSQELLDILRCPNCVRDGPEAGLLDHTGNWLICKDCERKYPIRDDIPVMLIEEGDRFRDIPREDLPETPPPEERKAAIGAPTAAISPEDRARLALGLVGAALGVGLIILLVVWLRGRRSDE